MTVPFQTIPQNLRVPFFHAEVNNSQANSATGTQRALIIGQITAAGVATPNIPILSAGIGDAITQGGPGSMLANELIAYRAADSIGEIWLLPLADASGSVAATGSITINQPPTAGGTLYLYVAGQLVTQPVLPTQTAVQIAAALAASINAVPNIPVVATASANAVSLTALNKGVAGNDFDIRFNYRGTANGQVFPAGFSATIAPFSGGAVNPTLTTALSNLSTSKSFDFILCPYTQSEISVMMALLNDQSGRWSWEQGLYGHVFSAVRGTVGALQTAGAGLNYQHLTLLGIYDVPTPNYICAASLMGAAAVSIRANPATPLNTLAIPGMLPPPVQSMFQLTDQNTLLFNGISTFSVQSGVCQIQKLITTYQTNAYGQSDSSYLNVETMFMLTAVLRALASVITTKYARVSLADDGTVFAPGSSIVTPSTVRGDLIAQYQQLEYQGLVQNLPEFAANLIVERNATNPNRLDVLYPGVLIDQLDILALLFQFRLQ